MSERINTIRGPQRQQRVLTGHKLAVNRVDTGSIPVVLDADKMAQNLGAPHTISREQRAALQAILAENAADTRALREIPGLRGL